MRPLHRLIAFKPHGENAFIRFIEAGHANGDFVPQRDVFISLKSNSENVQLRDGYIPFLFCMPMANVASLDHSKRNPAMRFLNRFQKNIGL
jgi:hypothetical protein